MAKGSSVAINKIRTGNGDGGDTKLGGKTYRKGHPIVKFSAALDAAQGFSSYLPAAGFGKRLAARKMIQEVLFRIGAAIGSRNPKSQEMPLVELGQYMELEIKAISAQLKPLDSFLRCSFDNHHLQMLRAAVREAEVRCIETLDWVSLEAKDTSPGLLHILPVCSKALNIASDFVFAYVWLMSSDSSGVVNKVSKWLPMTDEEIRALNEAYDINELSPSGLE